MRDAMTDEQLLMALHLRDHEGLMTAEIGERLSRSKNSVVGALNRINRDTDASDPDGNQNGSMAPLWWRR